MTINRYFQVTDVMGEISLIDHIILLKFSENTTEEQLLEVIDRFKALKNHLWGIVEIQGGLNFSSRNQGFQTVLMIRFEDHLALEAYETNAEHHACSCFIREVGRVDGIVVDYELEPLCSPR